MRDLRAGAGVTVSRDPSEVLLLSAGEGGEGATSILFLRIKFVHDWLREALVSGGGSEGELSSSMLVSLWDWVRRNLTMLGYGSETIRAEEKRDP